MKAAGRLLREDLGRPLREGDEGQMEAQDKGAHADDWSTDADSVV
jgi:hypothetical protein